MSQRRETGRAVVEQHRAILLGYQVGVTIGADGRKIQLYDKGIAKLHDFIESPESFAEFQFQIRVGDVTIPTFAFNEPLQDECRHFIECVESGRKPLTDGWNGLRVVRALEAADRSLHNNGQPVDLALSGVKAS